MDCSMPGLPVLHHLPEFAQTHVHWIGDAIQLSHPLSSPSPPAFNHSEHQGIPVKQLFVSGGQNIGASASAAVLSVNIQGWFPLGLTGLISFLSSGLSKSLLQHHNLKVSVLQCSAFFMVQLLHPYMTPRKTRALTICAVGTRSRKQTQKDNAHTGVQFITPAGPRQSFRLSQGPQPAFVKIFYTPCVHVWTHHPNFLETYTNQGKYNPNNPMIHVLCAQTVKQLANNQ